ncbi:MAG: sulfurtransferase [Peptostreptococcaceae bacterium]
MKNIVSPNWLKENINNKKLVIVDCRFDLNDKEYGKKQYEKEHIKGAKRVDIETELSSEIKEYGGRHPLPSIKKLEEVFSNIGINTDSIVVAYDEGDLAGPSRLWWILKYLGHKEVYVLEGGINVFKSISGEVTNKIEESKKGDFKANSLEELKADMEYVKSRVNNNKIAIIDSREHKRYLGEFEPVDIKAGHIPGALNYFWMDILDKKDNYISLKSLKELNEIFKELRVYDEVIVYCGSGITACSNSLALDEINIKHKVYCGSFSDWISYEGNEVQTGINDKN